MPKKEHRSHIRGIAAYSLTDDLMFSGESVREKSCEHRSNHRQRGPSAVALFWPAPPHTKSREARLFLAEPISGAAMPRRHSQTQHTGPGRLAHLELIRCPGVNVGVCKAGRFARQGTPRPNYPRPAPWAVNRVPRRVRVRHPMQVIRGGEATTLALKTTA